MKTNIEKQADKYLVTLEGELDTAAATEVEKTLQPLYSTNGLDVIIDCAGLEYIASSGLRILIIRTSEPDRVCVVFLLAFSYRGVQSPEVCR